MIMNNSFCKCLGCNSKIYFNKLIFRKTEHYVVIDCPFCNVELRLIDLKIETETVEPKETKMVGKIFTNQENVELFKIAFGMDRNNKELDKELLAALIVGINPIKSSEEIKKENSDKKKKALQELKNLFDYVEQFNSTTNYAKHFKDELSDKIFTEILALEEDIAINK